jgi:hypothetical protein
MQQSLPQYQLLATAEEPAQVHSRGHRQTHAVSAGECFRTARFQMASTQASRLTLTIAAGLLNAAGGLAIAPLAHVLIRGDGVSVWIMAMLALLALRPLFGLLHTRGICALVEEAAVLHQKNASVRIVNNLIVATRDVPLLILLLCVMPLLWGGAGLLIGCVTVAGMVAAMYAHKLLKPRTVTAWRVGRAYRELASELPFTFLILILFAARGFGALPAVGDFGGLAVCLLVMRAPVRRIARVSERRRWEA